MVLTNGSAGGPSLSPRGTRPGPQQPGSISLSRSQHQTPPTCSCPTVAGSTPSRPPPCHTCPASSPSSWRRTPGAASCQTASTTRTAAGAGTAPGWRFTTRPARACRTPVTGSRAPGRSGGNISFTRSVQGVTTRALCVQGEDDTLLFFVVSFQFLAYVISK